ncbi:MAG: hypothetical protein GX351_03450 [Peptococcaceae bacterium]|nr:hypothetical protein [Peptococcaceae bacterium]
MSRYYESRNLPWVDTSTKSMKYGRVYVCLESGEDASLTLYNGGNSKLPAYLIYFVLKIVFGSEWIKRLDTFHLARSSRWQVEIILKTEDSKEYRLYSCEDSSNEPCCSSKITVLNGGIASFSIQAKDATPLLKEIIEDYPPIFLPRYKNYRYTYFFPTNNFFFYPNELNLAKLPELKRRLQQETASIKPEIDSFWQKAIAAGEPSGIEESIEALKCLEVFLA